MPLVGRRALVPLGRRKLTGVITEQIEKPDLPKISEISELLDEQPVFSDEMMSFCRWISEYYMASLGETFKAALPAGFSPKSVLRATSMIDIDSEEMKQTEKKAPARFAVLKELINSGGGITIQALEDRTGVKNVSQILDSLERLGHIRTERLVEKQSSAKLERQVSLSPAFFVAERKQLFDELDRKAPKQSFLLSILATREQGTKMSFPELMKTANVSRSSIESLIEKGWLEVIEVEINRSQLPQGDKLATRNEITLQLTSEQQTALDGIKESVQEQKFKAILLHGVTGSGKTLVYLHAIAEAHSAGKTALMIVPEILLTQQLIDRFDNSFPGEVAVMHSRMSEGERYDSWRQIRSGKAKIVIGARSAIFSPLANPGIIIVDEEHEHSYKQTSPAPRYHGRDAAIMLAKLHKCPVVLGSATPSMESKYNAQTGKYSELTIMQRADKAIVPAIEVIDMISARKNGKIQGSFSDILLDEIKEKLAKKEGIILLQNRRGYSPLLECKNCGHVPMCENCDITLTYHKYKNLLICHYCGYARPASKSCEVCLSSDIDLLGFGTQRIEEELSDILSRGSLSPVIDRIDLDSVSRKGSLRKKLSRFFRGETDILIGTQMVAKGLDFDRVTLVGVINADMQLYMPDFRAAEKTYQLITQVAGRAGRSGKMPGKVIVQSSNPQHYAVQAAAGGNFDVFHEKESGFRREGEYPPYSRFTLIEFTAKEEHQCQAAAANFASLLPPRSVSLRILGPTPPRVARLKGLHRRIIIIKSLKSHDPSGNYLRRVLKFADTEYKRRYAKSSVKYVIDIDSLSAF